MHPGTKITRSRDGRYKINSPKGWANLELNSWHTNNSPKERWHKNNSPKDGKLNDLHENNWPKGRTDGELNRRHETNFSEELNGRHKNNLPKGEKLNGRHEDNSPKGWTADSKWPKEGTDGKLMVRTKITRQIDGWHKNNSPRGWTDRVKWLAQN